MVTWDDVSDEFALDGSLRDICITDVSIADWHATWNLLQGSGLNMTYTVDAVKTAPPDNVAEIFAGSTEPLRMLAVLVGGAQLNCHFFDESEIEFDLHPREITGQLQLDAVVGFMAALATATGRVVLMTPENMHDDPFLRVAPSTVTEYITTGGFFRDAADQTAAALPGAKRRPTSR
jgi:hypothetical protein